jgi:hypothetical protein
VDQSLSPEKFVSDILHIAMLGIESVIQLLHLLIGNLPA